MGHHLMTWPGAAALLACLGSVVFNMHVSLAARSPSPGSALAAEETDLDALMARVLEQRDENWRRLHEYVLSEKERFDIRDSAGQRKYGGRREYIWYIRDGYFIRSPLRFNGVTITESERRDYEARWLKEEKQREARATDEKAQPAETSDADEVDERDVPDETADVQALAGAGVEPRFISQAYFLDFKFEPGHYYFAGRETLERREVLRIEYYPSRLFDADERHAPTEEEEEFARKLNKVALITLWVDPKEEQIVKYTFDNTGYEFFPLRWLARVDDVSASMVMAPYLQGFWVPKAIAARATFTVAQGAVEVEYDREFYDYRKAETRARMRVGKTLERP
ncbi:MAG: hypothetical protein GEU99_02040 [Luteitalea sp.]|nr:hypothetical protein [Luteitalea sp.]